jgi:hypothetical protein
MIPDAGTQPFPWSGVANEVRAIELGDGVTSIGAEAFKDFTALEEITSASESPATLATTAFEGVDLSGVVLHIPSYAGDAYATAGWVGFKTVEPPVLTASAARLNFPADGSTHSIEVATNVSWTAVASAPWLSVSPASGTGDGTVVGVRVTASHNGGAARSATVKLEGSGLEHIISITQSQAGRLTVSASSLGFTSDGGTESVSVTSDSYWTASSDASWLSVSPSSGSGDGTVSVGASVNTGSERTATVTLKADGVTRTIEVTQEAKYRLDAEEPPYAEAGGNTSINVSFNIPASNDFEIEFTLALPAGFDLVENATQLAADLSGRYSLSVSPTSSNRSWRMAISPKATTRAGVATVYRQVMQIVCTVDPSLSMGNYLISLSNIKLKDLNENITLSQGELRIPVWVTIADNAPTGTATVETARLLTYQEGLLTIYTPEAEEIAIYSPAGLLLYRVQKGVGEALCRISHFPKGVLIVKGSSGWAKKIVH